MERFIAEQAIERRTRGDARDIATVAAEIQTEWATLYPPKVIGPKEVVATNIQKLPNGTMKKIVTLGDGSETVEESRWR